MNWVPRDAAVYETQRKLGVSLINAIKALREACDRDEVISKRDDEGDYFVLSTSLDDWLKAKKQDFGGKQSRIIALLAERFPNGVPNRSECPRERLRADLLKADPSLRPLNLTTLKDAIDNYNATRKRSDRSVSN